MRFTVERNWIDILGVIWLPPVTAGYKQSLTKYDMENIGEPTRENVEQWLTSHSGNFQRVIDFHAVVGEVDIPWEKEENEFEYLDCVGGCEE
jgi:hypothetical protein